MTIVTNWHPVWESQQRSRGISQGRGEIIVVQTLKSFLSNNRWWKIHLHNIKKPLGDKQKSIPRARKRIFSEELDISDSEMNFTYLSNSLLFPSPLPHSLVFQNWNFTPTFSFLIQGTCSEMKEHLFGYLPYSSISSASDFFMLLFISLDLWYLHFHVHKRAEQIGSMVTH